MEMALPYINEAFILLSALSMAIGWVQIRRRHVETHKRFMILGSVLAAAFFVTYVLKTVIFGSTQFGGPESWKLPYQVFLQIHSVLATVAAILGLVTIRWAYKAKFAQHRKIGPWTATVWFITAFSGLCVFLLLYIVYPPGPTTNVFRAWLGH